MHNSTEQGQCLFVIMVTQYRICVASITPGKFNYIASFVLVLVHSFESNIGVDFNITITWWKNILRQKFSSINSLSLNCEW